MFFFKVKDNSIYKYQNLKVSQNEQAISSNQTFFRSLQKRDLLWEAELVRYFVWQFPPPHFYHNSCRSFYRRGKRQQLQVPRPSRCACEQYRRAIQTNRLFKLGLVRYPGRPTALLPSRCKLPALHARLNGNAGN